MNSPHPLLRICALLNQAQARYLIIGGQACILHGLVRTTEDVDVLIEASEENALRVISALSHLEDHAAAELTPADILDNVVVKIADEIEVDVSTKAWKVNYPEAIISAQTVVIEGIPVPFLSLDCLISSKETYREQDQWDLLHLRALKSRQAKS
ncbi:MAG: hypothetical protein WCO56_14590 [Verrucomicrobiota bacterium]